MTTLPVIMCIDVEPHDREIDPLERSDWKGFEHAYHFFRQLRPRLEAATGARVRFSWFLRMDPQIEHTYGSPTWVVTRYPELIDQLQSDGDELGLHIHAWRWDGIRRKWVADHGNQLWVEQCVRTSFDAFQRALGRPCQSFRFGDRWMNNETMSLVEELGAKFDLSIEPGHKAASGINARELSTGTLPDSRCVPLRPFRPSRTNFREPDPLRGFELRVIPLSTAKPGRPTVKQLLNIKMMAKYHVARFKGPSQLNPCINATEFHDMIDTILQDRGDGYLAPVMRVDGFSRPKHRSNLEQNFAHLLSHPLVERFRFVTPATAVELLS